MSTETTNQIIGAFLAVGNPNHTAAFGYLALEICG